MVKVGHEGSFASLNAQMKGLITVITVEYPTTGVGM
jgi:hypothetical protein